VPASGGQARIIRAAFVTPADVQDHQAFLDRLDRVRFRSHLPVRRAVAESTCATAENRRALSERGSRGSMPLVEYDRSSPCVRQHASVDAAATDTDRCPHGETVTVRGNHSGRRTRSYAAAAAVCQAGPVRECCTDSTTGRRLNRSFDEDDREVARQLQTTEAYKKALRTRQVWVEPRFGEAKAWHNLRRLRLPG
jgi:hypothetical protein